MEVTVKSLKEKSEQVPEIPSVHFPSWDYLYMRDIKKLQAWISDFVQAFGVFEAGLREKLVEAQKESSEPHSIELLKDILGE